MYNATAIWLLNLSSSLVTFLSGFLINAAGWKTGLGAQQSSGTFLAMRLVFCLGTIVLALAAALLLRGYGITENTIKAARAEMEARRNPH
jgi:Na+/melibiose symporter-like transporter